MRYYGREATVESAANPKRASTRNGRTSPKVMTKPFGADAVGLHERGSRSTCPFLSATEIYPIAQSPYDYGFDSSCLFPICWGKLLLHAIGA